MAGLTCVLGRVYHLSHRDNRYGGTYIEGVSLLSILSNTLPAKREIIFLVTPLEL